MTIEEIDAIALKRAGYALAMIADRQMATWLGFTETPRQIIARQMVEAMNDAISAIKEDAKD